MVEIVLSSKEILRQSVPNFTSLCHSCVEQKQFSVTTKYYDKLKSVSDVNIENKSKRVTSSSKTRGILPHIFTKAGHSLKCFHERVLPFCLATSIYACSKAKIALE